MTDRDIFAAAALTGLLSNIPRYQNGPVTEQAYELAEFMLRERDKTNHDAVPEARADGQGRDNPDTPDRVGTGNTQKPVAWARFFPNGGPMSVFLDRPPADAEPLYRSPTLTDEEREAVTGRQNGWSVRLKTNRTSTRQTCCCKRPPPSATYWSGWEVSDE